MPKKWRGTHVVELRNEKFGHAAGELGRASQDRHALPAVFKPKWARFLSEIERKVGGVTFIPIFQFPVSILV